MTTELFPNLIFESYEQISKLNRIKVTQNRVVN